MTWRGERPTCPVCGEQLDDVSTWNSASVVGYYCWRHGRWPLAVTDIPAPLSVRDVHAVLSSKLPRRSMRRAFGRYSLSGMYDCFGAKR